MLIGILPFIAATVGHLRMIRFTGKEFSVAAHSTTTTTTTKYNKKH